MDVTRTRQQQLPAPGIQLGSLTKEADSTGAYLTPRRFIMSWLIASSAPGESKSLAAG